MFGISFRAVVRADPDVANKAGVGGQVADGEGTPGFEKVELLG